MRACPSTRHFDVHVLIIEHLSFRIHVAEVYGTVPVLIIVSWLVLTIAHLTIGTITIAVDTNLRIGKELPVADYAHYRQRVLVRSLDIAACYGNAGQISVFEQSESKVRRVIDGEVAILAFLAGVWLYRQIQGRQLPRHVVEIIVVIHPLNIQIEHHGLHTGSRTLSRLPIVSRTRLFVGYLTLIGKFLPLGGDVIAAVHNTTVDIVVRSTMRLRSNACSLVGTNLETETVSLASLPDVVRGIYEELCRPVVGSIG